MLNHLFNLVELYCCKCFCFWNLSRGCCICDQGADCLNVCLAVWTLCPGNLLATTGSRWWTPMVVGPPSTGKVAGSLGILHALNGRQWLFIISLLALSAHDWGLTSLSTVFAIESSEWRYVDQVWWRVATYRKSRWEFWMLGQDMCTAHSNVWVLHWISALLFCFLILFIVLYSPGWRRKPLSICCTKGLGPSPVWCLSRLGTWQADVKKKETTSVVQSYISHARLI